MHTNNNAYIWAFIIDLLHFGKWSIEKKKKE